MCQQINSLMPAGQTLKQHSFPGAKTKRGSAVGESLRSDSFPDDLSDEQFSVDAMSGAAMLRLPVPLGQGVNGFTPDLSLHYDSRSENSVFGLGWNLDLPSIRRMDARTTSAHGDTPNEAEIFQLTDCGELSPQLCLQSNGDWVPDEAPKKIFIRLNDDAQPEICLIKAYRPRVSNRYARIEHIICKTKGSWWRTIATSGVTTWYGLTAAARIVDPHDGRIFEWLPQLATDDKGNIQHFIYKREYSESMSETGAAFATNFYLKNVRYDNRTCFRYADSYSPALPGKISDFSSELVLDYGEHGGDNIIAIPSYAPALIWAQRPDDYNASHTGFEIPIKRCCCRLLMFTRPAGTNRQPVLDRSLDFIYGSACNADEAGAIFIKDINLRRYRKTDYGMRLVSTLPVLKMNYESHISHQDEKGIHLMTAYSNGDGKTVTINYEDLAAYRPCNQAKYAPGLDIPYSMHCVSRVLTSDAADKEIMRLYSYYNGHHNRLSRLFYGFGRVEILETCRSILVTAPTAYSAPQLTKTWYHNGAWLAVGTLQDLFAEEYSLCKNVPRITQAIFDFNAGEADALALISEADRSLTGHVLRREVYTLDGAGKQEVPHSVVISSYQVTPVQPNLGRIGAVCFSIKQRHQLYYNCKNSED